MREVEVGRRLLDQPAVGVLTDRHHERVVLRHQDRQAVGGGHDVVVHQPDPVEALVVCRLHARPEPTGAAGVLVEVDALEVQAAVGVEHLARVVGAGVVDDDHRVGLVGLRGEPVEGPAEQVGAVVGHDDDRDGLTALGHDRNLSWPVKSLFSASCQALMLSRIRPGSRRVKV